MRVPYLSLLNLESIRYEVAIYLCQNIFVDHYRFYS